MLNDQLTGSEQQANKEYTKSTAWASMPTSIDKDSTKKMNDVTEKRSRLRQPPTCHRRNAFRPHLRRRPLSSRSYNHISFLSYNQPPTEPRQRAKTEKTSARRSKATPRPKFRGRGMERRARNKQLSVDPWGNSNMAVQQRERRRPQVGLSENRPCLRVTVI